ncbi:MAG: aminopeptidase P family protein [Pseudomonadota bacterium]
MFQSFDNSADSTQSAARVARVRVLMAKAGLDALLVPRADEHQGEYVPPSAERLAWLTGFTGSAGLAVLTLRSGALLVDGRYTVQARRQVDTRLFELPALGRPRLGEWLAEKVGKGAVVGFDPWLHTAAEVSRLEAQLAPKGVKLRPTPRNLVDRAWGTERPEPPRAPIIVQPLKRAGRSPADKIADVQRQLADSGQTALILTLPDSICWLLNIRGSDVAHNPVVLAFAIVPANGRPELFVAPEKVTDEARAHLAGLVRLSPPEALLDRVRALRKAGARVRIDHDSAAWALVGALGPKLAEKGADPCVRLKAAKNAAELAGARAAHERDGVAVVRFLAWLDRGAPKGKVDEIEAVRRLESFRADTNALAEISFDTISGSGPNGAIVHYRVTADTNRRLGKGELFLIDSGGQYPDGTTDITRTVAIGKPSEEMRERFTLVLKGHIAIATARFPKGTRGIDLDPFARRALWERGLDYDHGTGHGVGSYLSVHEGPQSISKSGMVALEPGMICSNEPGYYKEGAYGIRIENLVVVTPPATPDGGDREMMGFETLTLAPIDRRLVARKLLSEAERAWLDAYHARVAAVLAPKLDAETARWLAAACAPI